MKLNMTRILIAALILLFVFSCAKTEEQKLQDEIKRAGKNIQAEIERLSSKMLTEINKAHADGKTKIEKIKADAKQKIKNVSKAVKPKIKAANTEMQDGAPSDTASTIRSKAPVPKNWSTSGSVATICSR